jgi:nudix-type nucleoside diphosphatase (YffH/AdpP family)
MPGGRDFTRQKPVEKCKGFLSIDEVTYDFRKYDGNMSGPQTRDVMRRGDSAAVLAYDQDLQQVILVEQFRIATVRDDRPGEGWLLEIPAGVVREGRETALECARRELGEETGYVIEAADKKEDKAQLDRFQHIATILPSAGGTSERIFIYFVEVRSREKIRAGGGQPEEGEDIRTLPLSPEALFRMLDEGELQDAKLHVAAQWFRRNMPAGGTAAPGTRPYLWLADKTASDPRIIGIKTGPISEVHGVDIWVNSENTDMLMDRFFGTSVSATIRYMGAEKHPNGTIYRDTIAENLRSRLGGQIFVRPGTIVVTKPGALRRRPHKVRRILHAAAVQGVTGRGLFASLDVSGECARNVLLQAEALNFGIRRLPIVRYFRRPYRSIVLPLFGAGQPNIPAPEVARLLVAAAVDFFDRNRGPLLREIYFIAYSNRHVGMFETELRRYEGKLAPQAPSSAREPAAAARE